MGTSSDYGFVLVVSCKKSYRVFVLRLRTDAFGQGCSKNHNHHFFRLEAIYKYGILDESMSEFATRPRSVAIATSLAVLLGGCSNVTIEIERPTVSQAPTTSRPETTTNQYDRVRTILGKIAIKGRAPMTGYDRDYFHFPSGKINGCPTYDAILKRDMGNIQFGKNICEVLQGTLIDPYTGAEVTYREGLGSRNTANIDHIVALGDAWQKGAQQFSDTKRKQFANDPLNLFTTSRQANTQKHDGDAATWMPPVRAVWCDYVSAQIIVKDKYDLWMTQAEHDRIATILQTC